MFLTYELRKRLWLNQREVMQHIGNFGSAPMILLDNNKAKELGVRLSKLSKSKQKTNFSREMQDEEDLSREYMLCFLKSSVTGLL